MPAAAMHHPKLGLLLDLRFESGNVKTSLSRKSKYTLLIHSDVVRTAFPTLAPSLNPRWRELTKVTHPNMLDKGEMLVYLFAFKYVEEKRVYLLEGGIVREARQGVHNINVSLTK
jgi:hypothetical protein